MSRPIACNNMIQQQLRTCTVLNQSILSLYEKVPRNNFVPHAFRNVAYSDAQIPLAHHQTMMTPLEEAILLQSLALTGNETVLEIGTGSGFLTALLSHLCKKVISVDYYDSFTRHATRELAKHNCHNVELHTGDASRGWIDQAPYDVIVITGALPALTPAHRLQLLPGGKLFAVIGQDPLMQGQLHTLDHNKTWNMQVLFETNIALLIDSVKTNEFIF